MDLTLLILARSNTHDMPIEKEGGRWREGDPVDLWEHGQIDVDHQPECFEAITIRDWSGTLQEAKEYYLATDPIVDLGKAPAQWQSYSRRLRYIDYTKQNSSYRASISDHRKADVSSSALVLTNRHDERQAG